MVSIFDDALRKSCPHVTLLPNLHHLTLKLLSPSSFRRILIPELFLGPTVTAVRIYSGKSECCRPKLEPWPQPSDVFVPNYTISKCYFMGRLLDESLLNIFRTINLFGFRFPRTVVSHLERLSSLTTLGCLNILAKDVKLFQNGGFPNLEKLSVTTDGWSSSAVLLESLPRAFTSLPVTFSVEYQPISMLRGFTKALQPSFGSLSVIKLYGSTSSFVSDIPLDAEAVMSKLPTWSVRYFQSSSATSLSTSLSWSC